MVQGMRIYDIEAFVNGEYYIVELREPIKGNDSEFSAKMKNIELWTDVHCEGEYIILLNSVIIKKESDALIFTLKYG